MSQKNKQQQLLKKKEKLENDKAKLEAIKANQPEKWTQQLQVKLDEIIGEIADVDEEIVASPNLLEESAKEESTKEESTKEESTKEESTKEESTKEESTKEESAKEESAKEEQIKEMYTPSKGTEKLIHLSIVHGRRFNPTTGKEESLPYIQMFTHGEFLLFKKTASLLGYSVLKVLYDPYNEAHEMIVKQ